MERMMVGGYSSINRVVIFSDECFSSVVYNAKSGKIFVKTKRGHRLRAKFRISSFFQLLRAVGVVLFSIILSHFSEGFLLAPDWLMAMVAVMFISGCVYLLVLFEKLKVNPLVIGFHGAEHKVIAAYRSWPREYSLARASKKSPISKNCGTIMDGFVVALLISGLLVALVAIWINLYWLLIPWLMFFFFMIDFLCIGSVGKYTQKWFTVREPLEYELLTAHCAMLGLLMAHGEDVEMPPEAILEEGAYRYSASRAKKCFW